METMVNPKSCGVLSMDQSVCLRMDPFIRVDFKFPIGSMYGIYANIGGILMVNVTIYGIHGSYGSGIYI